MNKPAKAPSKSNEDAFMDTLVGENYLNYLQKIHEKMNPRSYFEIGTRSGDSLALAKCASIAVDPEFAISSDVIGTKPFCMFFQQTSDDFFLHHDPFRLLGGSIDFAFLDGLHLFEVLLRDFINTEKYCRSDSVIAMHDCVPTDIYVAERKDDPERRKEMGSEPTWWTGDVWKLIPILRRWRPDISLITLDCWPSGLLLATNLDSGSTSLANYYNDIMAEFIDITLAQYGIRRLFDELDIRSAAETSLPVIWNTKTK